MNRIELLLLAGIVGCFTLALAGFVLLHFGATVRP